MLSSLLTQPETKIAQTIYCDFVKIGIIWRRQKNVLYTRSTPVNLENNSNYIYSALSQILIQIQLSKF